MSCYFDVKLGCRTKGSHVVLFAANATAAKLLLLPRSLNTQAGLVFES